MHVDFGKENDLPFDVGVSNPNADWYQDLEPQQIYESLKNE